MSDVTEPTENQAHAGELRLTLFGRTDVGQVREHNEDNFLVANLSTEIRGLKDENRAPVVRGNGMVIGVCDGMGGAAAGEVASQLAVDMIYEQLASGGPADTDDELARRLVRAIEQAGSRIFQEARADRSRRGMGTTATIAAFRGKRLFFGQVGDSRAYLLRAGKLTQVTRDQSLVNQLIEAGQLTEEEAETFEHNNIILQALGTAETVQVDLTFADAYAGDVLMMCSDGLSGMLRGDEIQSVLERMIDPLEACRELTDRANAAGGHDNITVIVARFGEGFGKAPSTTPTYQKYALPDAGERLSDTGIHASLATPGDPSDEARREDRQLRVSHTVIGMAPPTLDPLADTLSGRKRSALHSESDGEETPSSGTPSPRLNGERLPPVSDPPVNLPTSGLPPVLMGTLVVSAMVLAALLGYLAMR
jgi:serine/threonine protein phosphatase PrpC